MIFIYIYIYDMFNIYIYIIIYTEVGRNLGMHRLMSLAGVIVNIVGNENLMEAW